MSQLASGLMIVSDQPVVCSNKLLDWMLITSVCTLIGCLSRPYPVVASWSDLYRISMGCHCRATGLSLFLFTPLGSITRLRLSSCLVSRRLSWEWNENETARKMKNAGGILRHHDQRGKFLLLFWLKPHYIWRMYRPVRDYGGNQVLLHKFDINARLIKTKKFFDKLFDSSVEYKDINRYNKTTVYRAYWKETFSVEEQEIIHHCIICLEPDLADQPQGPGCFRGYWIMNDRSSYRYVLCDRNLRHISLLLIWIPLKNKF